VATFRGCWYTTSVHVAIYLIYFIRKSVAINKTEIINPKGDDFIAHTAEDLEFKREYGAELPKRKRGRPRKTL